MGLYEDRCSVDELAEPCHTDAEYALRQLALAREMCSKAPIVLDCLHRATDALERIRGRCAPLPPEEEVIPDRRNFAESPCDHLRD